MFYMVSYTNYTYKHNSCQQIDTRNSDGAIILTFETGQYEVENVKELFGILDKMYKVTVEVIE